MGCANSKQFHDHNLRDELKIQPRKGSSSSLRRLVSSSSSKRREELEEEEEVVVITNAERSSSLRRLIPKTHNNNTSIPAQSRESENKANTAIEVTGHHRRRRSRVNGTGFDARAGKDDENVKEEGNVNSSPNLSLKSDVPNGAEAEKVSAGWPRWLTDVAGEAVRGWVPRKAESFEKLDKVYLLTQIFLIKS
jgi:hypothetical protein